MPRNPIGVRSLPEPLSDVDIVEALVKNGALLTDAELRDIAYPHSPFGKQRVPSYVSVVATQAALKMVKLGYRLSEPPHE